MASPELGLAERGCKPPVFSDSHFSAMELIAKNIHSLAEEHKHSKGLRR